MKFLFATFALLLPATAFAGEYGPSEEEILSPAVEEAPAAPAAETFKWESFVATAYQPSCPGCSGVTADGTLANPSWNIIAVDPRVMRLGQRVVVRRKDGSCKVFTARDTGGAIKGNKVDILMRSHREAVAFGVQHIEIARIGKDQPSAMELAASGCTTETPQS